MTTTEPAFDGRCAFAVSIGKLGVAGSPKHRLEVDGRAYLFNNRVARFLWRVLPGRASRADQVWQNADR